MDLLAAYIKLQASSRCLPMNSQCPKWPTVHSGRSVHTRTVIQGEAGKNLEPPVNLLNGVQHTYPYQREPQHAIDAETAGQGEWTHSSKGKLAPSTSLTYACSCPATGLCHTSWGTSLSYNSNTTASLDHMVNFGTLRGSPSQQRLHQIQSFAGTYHVAFNAKPCLEPTKLDLQSNLNNRNRAHPMWTRS
jgi:hypothetical protein